MERLLIAERHRGTREMSDEDDRQPRLRRQANDLLSGLAPAEREALLIKCWMSHDARWFMAVAGEYGMSVTNRLNRSAAYELGKVEAHRVARALHLLPVASLDDYLLAQEVFIGLLGPDLLDYRVSKVSDTTFRVDVQRCFAHDNAARVGVADQLECGIFTRITGWLDGLGLGYDTSPALGTCLKAQGRACAYTITLALPPGE